MRAALTTVLITVAVLLSACGDDTGPGSGADFTVTPASAWAGSEVLVRNEVFGQQETAPVFRLADSALAARAIDDSTWAVTLPSWASGQVTLKLALGSGHNFALGPVAVRGFTGAHAFAGGNSGRRPLVWRQSGDAVVLANDHLNLLEVNATTNQVTTYDSLVGGAGIWFTPGPSARKNAFVVWPADSVQAQVWALAPAAQKLATLDVKSAPYTIMELDSGRFLAGFGNMYSIQGPGAYVDFASEIDGGVMSPTHDRAGILAVWVREGLPVFDVVTGAIAYRVPGVQSAEGIAFSADGTQLLVAGSTLCRDCDSARVVLLRASDGQVLQDTTFHGHAWGVAFDRSRPLIYVGTDVADTVNVDSFGNPTKDPGILVLDASSFARLGLLAPPADAPACWGGQGQSGCESLVLETSDEPAVYAVGGYNLPHVESWRFATGD